MTDSTEAPVFVGTPDDWWQQAQTITEAEAAERVIGNWYITNEQRSANQAASYRVSIGNGASNGTRKAALRRAIEQGVIASQERISPHVRRLIQAQVETPPWLDADLVVANSHIGSSERLLWRKSTNGWQRVFDGRITVSLHTMLQLEPVAAEVVVARDHRG
ncbi:hypothetical protein SAMN06295974_3794 [Plantibacter flavus]|uniref:Uncharacterized protein n=1 Tax=Plantibacter flavus TaxID=150123 RepID=A0A3N2BLH4_9MICO|nr:hypothetical protein [Plantibacter flavus]ROR76058.1 hypothetical protein EDD42_4011 [Plantibacter flavus]SMG48952.1 hypothetical protein SAMN06295974_3794 [Plantibacter flavus]